MTNEEHEKELRWFVLQVVFLVLMVVIGGACVIRFGGILDVTP